MPRIYYEAGLLERFYTDIHVAHGWPRIVRAIPRTLQPRACRRLVSRGVEIADFPHKQVRTFPTLGLRYALRRNWAQNTDALTRVDLSIEDEFSRRVLKGGLGNATHLHCFDIASLGVMQAVANTGIKIIMDQTNAAHPVLAELLLRERTKHPGWEDADAGGTMDEVIQARYREAWALADIVVCGSEFVRAGVCRCGGPPSKCVVVPYGIDLGNAHGQDATWRCGVLQERYARRRAGEPLRVLTIGTVGLRKGAPYVLEAAKAFRGRASFRMVGAIDISQEAVKWLGQYVELTGLIPRNEVVAHYRWADVFLFPSVCEGSAGVVYEALAQGLPVICTPNTGSVARDGVDGLIVEPSSGEAVVAALEKVIANPDLCLTMAQNGFATSDQMNVKYYGDRLLRAVGMERV